MTTPGGVPNLPAGALTLDTLAAKTQDMSAPAMRSRAVERFPSIFNLSTGLNPALDVTPFGILTAIWAEVNSLIANADPADIQGPEDLPPLVLEFIEGLPFVGQYVQVLAAILGLYDGEDPTLLQIQDIFAAVRALMQLFGGVTEGFPTSDQITSGIPQFINVWLRPNGVVGIDDVLGDPNSGAPFPWSFPQSFGTGSTPISRNFTNLRRLINSDLSLPDLNIDDITANFVNTRLLPTALLASLTNGKLPDAQSPQLLLDMWAKFANILNPGSVDPATTPVVDLFTAGWNAFLQLFGLATQTQAQLSNIASQVAAVGTPLTVVPMSLNPFAVTSSGVPGANGFMQIIDGVASWVTSGGVANYQGFRDTTALASDFGAIRMTMPTAVQAKLPDNVDQAYNYLRGRIDLAESADVFARIGYDTAAIGFRTNYARTLIGQPVSIVSHPNDEWLFKFGDPDTNNKFAYQLWQNGNLILPVGGGPTDWVTEAFVNSWDSTHGAIYPGWAAEAGGRFQPGSTQTQTLPGSISGWQAYLTQ